MTTKGHYEALYVWLEDFVEWRHVTLIQRFRKAVPEVERYVGNLQPLSERFTYFERDIHTIVWIRDMDTDNGNGKEI